MRAAVRRGRRLVPARRAMLGDRLVAATMFLRWGDTLYYKFNASASMPWRCGRTICWSGPASRSRARSAAAALDLGPSDDDQPGLIRFKRKFGAAERELCVPATTCRRNGATTGRHELRQLLGDADHARLTAPDVRTSVTAAGRHVALPAVSRDHRQTGSLAYEHGIGHRRDRVRRLPSGSPAGAATATTSTSSAGRRRISGASSDVAAGAARGTTWRLARRSRGLEASSVASARGRSSIWRPPPWWPAPRRAPRIWSTSTCSARSI